ncbi:MAG: hypothetical protein GX159_11340, partial [Flavobacteriaceae bacterium]|nr:hypothetical protein [Flavobacteriaceae bacterium]
DMGYAYNYVYNYTDHLGNIRVSYSKDPRTNQLKILEENHYYPFGLKHSVYTAGRLRDFEVDSSNPEGEHVFLNNVTKTDYHYKYNGQEWQDELGLNMYAMDLRQYDPAIGRWVVIDPITHHSMSPYNAFDNNPVFWADPSGADAVDIGYDRIIDSQDMMGSYHWSGGFQEIENEGGDKKDTEYKTEKGETIAITDDGSSDVVTVPNNMLDDFVENVAWTNQDRLDSQGWNAYWKTEILGFESIEELDNFFAVATSDWSRNKLIKYWQDPTLFNWMAYCSAEVVEYWINPVNHLPSPKIKVKQTKGSINVNASPNLVNANKNPWILFNREMGVGKFTKEKFGSSEAANKARLNEYSKWKSKNGYGRR